MLGSDAPRKERWHACALQRLSPEELTSVVNGILRGELDLVTAAPETPGVPVEPLDKRSRRVAAIRRHLGPLESAQ